MDLRRLLGRVDLRWGKPITQPFRLPLHSQRAEIGAETKND